MEGHLIDCSILKESQKLIAVKNMDCLRSYCYSHALSRSPKPANHVWSLITYVRRSWTNHVLYFHSNWTYFMFMNLTLLIISNLNSEWRKARKWAWGRTLLFWQINQERLYGNIWMQMSFRSFCVHWAQSSNDSLKN